MRAIQIRPSAIVFDFDDTLVRDVKSKSYLYRDGKFIKSLTADEFHHYTKKPNETFDFTEFDFPKRFNPRRGPVWDLLESYDDLNRSVLFILTARRDTAKNAIYKFIVKNGIKNLPLDNIYCIGGPEVQAFEIPILKEQVIMEIIKPQFEKVIFYEDNDLAIDRVKHIPGVFPIHVK
jgi:hypothetical protein